MNKFKNGDSVRIIKKHSMYKNYVGIVYMCIPLKHYSVCVNGFYEIYEVCSEEDLIYGKQSPKPNYL